MDANIACAGAGVESLLDSGAKIRAFRAGGGELGALYCGWGLESDIVSLDAA